jgi:hypothetical protein
MEISMGRLIRSFFAHVFPKVVLPLRVLWNELIGFLFLLIALPAVWSAVANFRKVKQSEDFFWGGVLAVVFAGVMTFFGIYSFLRARRIARS